MRHNDNLVSRLLLFLALLFVAVACVTAQQNPPLQTFTLQERFGVTYPEQLVTCELTKPVDAQSTVLLGPDGREVPYQLIEVGKKLVFRTGLAANSRQTWTLQAGKPSGAPKDGVTVTKSDTLLEITNGLVGVRIPQATTALRPTPAPIQGVRYRDGAWTATGPNLLATPAKKMQVRLLEQGPLKVVVEVAYTFDRPEVRSGATVALPAGEGHYTSTIAVQAGQPSILIEDDTDTDFTYSLNIYDGLAPTQARYRGHHASAKATGYEADGQTYRMWQERPSMDALVDLQYETARRYPFMAVWNPWAVDSGWYWQLYDAKAPATANLFGIFAGRASRALGAGYSGVSVFTNPSGTSDCVSLLDAGGTLHLLDVVNGAARYTRIDKTLAPSKPERVATGLQNLELAVDGAGTVAITGYDPLQKRFMLIERKADGNRTTSPVEFANSEKLKFPEGFLYQTFSGDRHFLFFIGERDGKAGGLLFARKRGEKLFVFQEFVPEAVAGRTIWRPTLTTRPDGTVTLLFTRGQFIEMADIKPGALNFGGTATAGMLFNNERTRVLNFGSAFDTLTGDMLVVNSDGAMCTLPPEGEPITTALDLDYDLRAQGPNRTTFAAVPGGEALAVYNGALYRCRAGAWHTYPEANALKLTDLRVHYQAANKQFLLLGRRDGRLALYAVKPGETTPRLLQQLDSTGLRQAGITVASLRRTPDGRVFPHSRFHWGIFLGIKGEDLPAPDQVQPIARQMNIHGGINLTKLASYQLEYPDAPRGYGSLFMEKKAVDGRLEKLRADTSGPEGNGYHAYLVNTDPSSRELVAMWADTTGEKAHAAVANLSIAAHNQLDSLVNGDGIYTYAYHYWQGGQEMARKGAWIDSILANPQTTPEERAQVKAIAALYGYLLWDTDYLPLFDGHGLYLGTENMPIQQKGTRAFYTLLLADHPDMRGHLREVEQGTLADLRRVVNEQGAEIGCTHYIAATIAPLLNTCQQLRAQGKSDPFKTEERLAKFADFYLNFLTPPEVRFRNARKYVAFGDSSTESSELYGQLATGFATAKPDLSARLMGAWQQSGRKHSGLFGTTLLSIDEQLPAKDPQLGSATFPGYYSVLRHGWGTPDETAVWLINGDFYRDHRHNDHGAVTIYALGAPLSVDWGSIYTPQVAGGYMHSAVLPEAAIGCAWDQDSPPLATGGGWGTSTQEAFTAFSTATQAKARFTHQHGLQWLRTVTTVQANPAYPAILIRDAFAGPQANAAKVFSLNLMAQGTVETPAGPETPTLRTYKTNNELPSAGKPFTLPAGINRLGFTGQYLIDWELYTLADSPTQALLGNWAENWHQEVQNFEERQHILRIKGTGGFTTLILPYRKGEKRADLQVKRENKTLIITAGGETTYLGESFYAYLAGTKRIAAIFTAESRKVADLTLAGGPCEVVLDGKQAAITLDGAPGLRRITLPGAWKVLQPNPAAPAVLKNTEWQIPYAGGTPVTIILEKR